MKIPAQIDLYIRSMGKALRVTAMFTDVDAANEYMERHPDDAVVAEVGPYIMVANKYDRGTPIPRA